MSGNRRAAVFDACLPFQNDSARSPIWPARPMKAPSNQSHLPVAQTEALERKSPDGNRSDETPRTRPPRDLFGLIKEPASGCRNARPANKATESPTQIARTTVSAQARPRGAGSQQRKGAELASDEPRRV